MKKFLLLVFLAFFAGTAVYAQLIVTADGADVNDTEFDENGETWTIASGSVQNGNGGKWIYFPANTTTGQLSWTTAHHLTHLKVGWELGGYGLGSLTIKGFAELADIPGNPAASTTTDPGGWPALTEVNFLGDGWNSIKAITIEHPALFTYAQFAIDDLEYEVTETIYPLYLVGTGNWENTSIWSYDTDDVAGPDTPANAYPKLDGSREMSDGTKIEAIHVEGGTAFTVTIDANTTPGSQGGTCGIALNGTGADGGAQIDLQLTNFSGYSFTLGNAMFRTDVTVDEIDVFTVGDYTGGTFSAANVNTLNFTHGVQPYSTQTFMATGAGNITVSGNLLLQSTATIETSGDFTVNGGTTVRNSTVNVTAANVIAIVSNGFIVENGGTYNITGNLDATRPLVKHGGTLSVSENLNLNFPVSGYPHLDIGTDNNPGDGEALCAIGGNLLIDNTQNTYSVKVGTNGKLTVGGYMDTKGLDILAGGVAEITGNLNLKYPSGFVTLAGPADGTYGIAKLTVSDSIIVSNSTGNAITIGENDSIIAAAIITPGDITVDKGGTLDVAGDVKMKSLTINAGGNASINDDLELQAASGHLTLNGPTDATYGAATLLDVDTLLVSSATGNRITVGEDAELGANYVITPGELQVDAGGSLGTVLVHLTSDASKSASFINQGSFTGAITYDRYLTGVNKWHIISSPVSNQNIWSFATLAVNNVAENAGKRAVTEYLEGLDDWDTNYPTGDTEGDFTPGHGYSMLRASDGTVTFSGSLNAVDIPVNIHRTTVAAAQGWNAVGNPYPSAIGATSAASSSDYLLNTTNVADLDPNYAALYVWDAANGEYKIINNSGDTPTGTLSQDYIQAGQGFFVRAVNIIGDVFTFTKAMQTHQTSTPLKSAETPWPTIELAVEGNNKKSSTILAFNQNMTTGLDVTYDAGMFKSDKEFALYSRLVDDNGVDFAIQALPEDYENLVIPIGLDVPAGTEVTFKASSMNVPADAAVWLEDRSIGTFTRLDQSDAAYTTIIAESTKGVGNFFIHTKYSVTGVNDLAKENAYRVLVNRNQGYLRIITTEEQPGQARLFDISGRLHGVLELEKGAENKMYLNANPGVYLIQVNGSSKAFSEKVVWK